MIKSVFFIFCIFVPVISHAQMTKDKIDRIIVDQSAEKELLLSDFFYDVEYVKLETNQECLLVGPSIYVTSKYIIATNFFQGAYLFDRKTGHFIREISKVGQGPNEYSFRVSNPDAFKESHGILLFDESDRWKGFDIEKEEFTLTITNPGHKYKKEGKYKAINNPQIIRDDVFVGYVNNVDGKTPYKLVFFNKQGVVFKEFENHIFYTQKSHDTPLNPGIFYKYNNNIYFRELQYNDTIFIVNENALLPRYVIDLGKMSPRLPHAGTEERVINGITLVGDNVKSCTIPFIQESDNYLLFKCVATKGIDATDPTSFYVCYDKNNNKVYSSPKNINSGFTDDINNLPDFMPVTKNESGEFAGLLDPEELMAYLRNHKGNDNLKKLKALQNIHEDDNPIVVIAKQKK